MPPALSAAFPPLFLMLELYLSFKFSFSYNVVCDSYTFFLFTKLQATRLFTESEFYPDRGEDD
jgi:hypothetical protein